MPFKLYYQQLTEETDTRCVLQTSILGWDPWQQCPSVKNKPPHLAVLNKIQCRDSI